jgi:hypothetical protein
MFEVFAAIVIILVLVSLYKAMTWQPGRPGKRY